ncbi:MAG TPA: UDP-N-acetylmuramoyl-L-alanine--D-glutamate ligase [Thermoanaerobaculia bacterium]|nr:UDP-N-acetylmuramoyl-L-alanine--D-glutamate ligase [Thermoanaerobaculia bacterium]
MKVPWGSGSFERVLVYGLGLSGRAAARLLLARGVAVAAVDDGAGVDPGELAAAPRFELLTGAATAGLAAAAGGPLPQAAAAWRGIDGVVVSPGVPPDRPLLAAARRLGLPVLAEVELAFPFLNGPVVAITGTNGKSTTTALAGALLAAAGHAVEVCGNIGEPLAGRVDGPPGRIFVVELSSFQIDGLDTFRPRAAAFLNLTEDHLDRYRDLAAYAASKRRLFRRQDRGDLAVLNADDPITRSTLATADAAAVGWKPRCAVRRRLFSRRGPVDDGCYLTASGTVVEVSPGEPSRELFAAAAVPLAGVQNLENAMAAALLARGMGADPEAVRRGLAGFRGLPHRMQQVAVHGGVTWYDDSKGTNPAATVKSLESFADGTVHLILGGRNKGADFAPLAPLARAKAKRLYLIGEAAHEIEQALGGAAPIERSGTLAAAVRAAVRRASPGEAVVLSPACASFDQFRNFGHRGDVFQEEVRATLGGPDGGGGGDVRGGGGGGGTGGTGGGTGGTGGGAGGPGAFGQRERMLARKGGADGEEARL